MVKLFGRIFKQQGIGALSSVRIFLYFSISMVMTRGLPRDTEEAVMRNVKNQDVPGGHAKAFCGGFKDYGSGMTPCAVSNHTRSLTRIQRDQNLSHELWKTLTQTQRDKSAKPYRTYKKKKRLLFSNTCSNSDCKKP